MYFREKEKQDLKTKLNELEEYKKKYEEEKKENEVRSTEKSSSPIQHGLNPGNSQTKQTWAQLFKASLA